MGETVTDSAGARTLWRWLIALVTVGFVTWTYGQLRFATSPNWQDTPGYLAHALYVAEHGDLLGFLRECFTGTFPITERHPLYFLILAPFASRTADFFWVAKFIDLLTGLLVLLSLVWMVARRHGRWPALIAAIVYALSNSLVIASSHVNNETQFVLCTLWAWWFLTEYPGDAKAADDKAGMPAPWTRWAIAGAWIGLAYLAKSPAVLLGLAVVVAGLWRARLAFITGPRLWVFLASAAIVGSPLLVRNVIGFGTPFYEGMNSSITWIDDWSEIGGKHSVMYYDQYGVMTIESNGMPTASTYLSTHSAGDIARRLVKGLITETTKVAPQALAFGVPPLGRSATLFGFLVLGLAIAGWWTRRRSWEGVLLFFSTGAFLTFFGWDHMFPEIRYLAPLVPIWIAFASLAVWQLLCRMVAAAHVQKIVAACAVAAVVVAGSWTFASGALTSKRPTMDATPAYNRLNDWLNKNIEAGDRVMHGPTREFYGLIWVIDRPISFMLTPDASTLPDFLRYLSERKVRYLVMHPENVGGEGGRLKDALAPYFEATAAGEIVAKLPLPGWEPVYSDPGSPRHFIIYEAKPADGVSAR